MKKPDVELEAINPLSRIFKKAVINPLANYLPARLLKKFLADGKSELALANWQDPGGWRSMVISYNGNPEKTWDKIMVNGGMVPMALRNRRKIGAACIAELLDNAAHRPAHAVCLGAGPGHIITDAMLKAEKDCRATLVDISSDAFEYGRKLAREKGLENRVTFLQGDVREVKDRITERVDLVKMIGICEYLSDSQITSIVETISQIMPEGAALVCNSISDSHGTDRFFRRVFGLHMIHRSPEKLKSFFEPAGFADWRVYPEPLGIYTLMIAKKGGQS